MKFEKTTKIGEVIQKAPKKIYILDSIGMECYMCPISYEETIEEACMVHGVDCDEVLEELNKEEPEDKKEETETK
jgi:hydroxylamine reductase